MKTKHLMIIGGVLIVAVGGYLYFQSKNNPKGNVDNKPSDVKPAGTPQIFVAQKPKQES